jgi:hypothetical protein
VPVVFCECRDIALAGAGGQFGRLVVDVLDLVAEGLTDPERLARRQQIFDERSSEAQVRIQYSIIFSAIADTRLSPI